MRTARAKANLAGLSDMRLIRDHNGEQLWRVTARTSALAGIATVRFSTLCAVASTPSWPPTAECLEACGLTAPV